MAEIDIRRRASFNEDPELYARARPGYPEAVFDIIMSYASIGPGARALEIGCGPGQATIPMLARGVRVTAVEIGPAMARTVQARTAGMDLTVEVCSFEEWQPRDRTFDLVFSGSAFHWVDPAERYTKTAGILRSGGALALFWNKHVRGPEADGLHDALQAIYDRETPDLTRDYRGLPAPEDLNETYRDEIEASGLFEAVQVRHVLWERAFTTEQYIELLDTYSDHHTLPEQTKQRLFAGVRGLIDGAHSGRITRSYATQIFLARRP